MRVAEVLDSSSDGSLKLNDGLSGVGRLCVDDDFEVHAIGFHDTLDGCDVDPERVGVEDPVRQR